MATREERRFAVELVGCPRCNVKRFIPCKSRRGGVKTHMARVRVVRAVRSASPSKDPHR